MKRFLIGGFILLVLWFGWMNWNNEHKKNVIASPLTELITSEPSSTPIPTPKKLSEVIHDEDPTTTQLLENIREWLPTVTWEDVQKKEESIAGNTYTGILMSGTMTSTVSAALELGERRPLLDAGWNINNEFTSAGSNGNTWGYTINTEGRHELLFVTVEDESYVPSPKETVCPCTLKVSFFDTDQY